MEAQCVAVTLVSLLLSVLLLKKKSIFCVRTSVYVCGAMIVQWKPEVSSFIVGLSCHVIIIVLLVCSLF